MCKVNTLKLNGRTIRVADLKRDFICNIAESIALCDHIQKVVLFGSCLESRCKETSDIDIAVFGDLPEGKMYSLKSYRAFADKIYDYRKPEVYQDYDILYFKTGDRRRHGIMSEIEKGTVLYEKQTA